MPPSDNIRWPGVHIDGVTGVHPGIQQEYSASGPICKIVPSVCPPISGRPSGKAGVGWGTESGADERDHGLAPKPKAPETLVQDLRQIIIDARRHVASAVNIALTLLYWRVGDRIRRDVLQNERARYPEGHEETYLDFTFESHRLKTCP
jgi:hypothetical protein